jgi:hypothetical protein
MNKIEELEKWWNRWKAKNGKHFTGKSEAKTGSAEGEKAFLSASWRRWQAGFSDRMTAEMTKSQIKNLSQKGVLKHV